MRKLQSSLLFVLLLIFTGCAAKMPPPVYDSHLLVEKTPKEIKELELLKTRKIERDILQKKKKDKARSAIKGLIQAISKARQNKIDELSKHNFDKVLKLFREATENIDAELYEAVIESAQQAQNILTMANQDAELQKQWQEKKKQQKVDIKKAKEEAEKLNKAAEQKASTSIKKAVAKMRILERKGVLDKLKNSLKETKVVLEDAYKLLNAEKFSAAAVKAEDVIKSIDRISKQNKKLSAKKPESSKPQENLQVWEYIVQNYEDHKYGEAYFALNDYLSDYPQPSHFDQAMFIIGHCFEEFKSYDRALSTYARLIDKFPSSSWSKKAVFRRSLVYTIINNHNLSEQQINKLKQLPDNNNYQDRILYASGKLAQNKEIFNQALVSFQALISKHPKSDLFPLSLKASAECYKSLRQVKKAQALYWKIYKSYPQSKAMQDVTMELSQLIYEEARELTKPDTMMQAREKYKLLIKDFPNSYLLDNATYWLAETYYVEGDYKNSLKYFQDVLNNDYYDYTDPNYLKDDDATLKSAYSYFNLKDFANAKRTFNELIEYYPQSDFRSDADYWIKLIDSQ